MNVNYILVALAVLTIACIYLFWLTFKQSQEILALSSRVNNSDVLDGGGGSEKNNKVITEVIKKVGEIDNNLNEVNKYIFGNLIPRLEGRHSTNDDVQAEEDEEVEDDNLTETDLENIERLGEDLENDADEENNVMLDDDEENNVMLDDDEENNDDTELNSGNNSDTLDLEIDDMPTLDMKESKMSTVNIDIHNLDDISINADDVDFSDLDVDDTSLSLENLKNKSLKELRTIAQDAGLKVKGNKNELINCIINT